MKPGMMMLGIAMCGFLVSCTTNYTQPIAPAQAMTVDQRNFEANWQASLDVLRKYNFVIDRQDRRSGIITTRPLLGRHWFEFWRHDAVGICNQWESTLQTIYRTATVHVSPAEQAGTFTTIVDVQTSRSDRVTQQPTPAIASAMFVLPGVPVSESALPEGVTPETRSELATGIVHLGPDVLLSEKLAQEINAAAGQRILQGNVQP